MMKSNWPSKILFKFTCHKKPVPNLLVYLSLLSKAKNNFAIGPLISDKYGEIQILHDDLSKIITDTKADYPMDYSGTLEDCRGIEVIIDNIDELKKRVYRLREFYIQAANLLESKINSCSNSKYKEIKMIYEQPLNFEIIEVEVIEKDKYEK